MNRLELRSEFEAVLSNYRLSKRAEQLLKDMKLVLLSGPSAAGRNTVIKLLEATDRYRFIVSDTTRKPRINDGIKEENGVSYWFRGEPEFLADLKKGEFLEAEIIHEQQVSGISIRELAKAHDSGRTAISEVEIGGFLNILKLKPDSIGIFVLPPSFDLWLERLFQRGKMPPEEIRNRLNTGIRIFREASERSDTFIVINDTLESTAKEIDEIVAEGYTPNASIGKTVAANLLKATAKYLAELK